VSMPTLRVSRYPSTVSSGRAASRAASRSAPAIASSSAAGRDPRTTPIREAMTDKVIYCFEDQDVREAAQLIEEKQIRRLPVLNRDKRLVGIVSVGDLAVRTHDKGLTGEVVERVSGPAQSGSWS
jgi:CBS-domain-containing membrane protein